MQKVYNKRLHKCTKKIIDLEYDVILGAESRGFLFGMPIAYNDEKDLYQ